MNVIYGDDDLMSYKNYLKDTISGYINAFNEVQKISPKYIELKCENIPQRMYIPSYSTISLKIFDNSIDFKFIDKSYDDNLILENNKCFQIYQIIEFFQNETLWMDCFDLGNCIIKDFSLINPNFICLNDLRYKIHGRDKIWNKTSFMDSLQD